MLRQWKASAFQSLEILFLLQAGGIFYAAFSLQICFFFATATIFSVSNMAPLKANRRLLINPRIPLVYVFSKSSLLMPWRLWSVPSSSYMKPFIACHHRYNNAHSCTPLVLYEEWFSFFQPVPASWCTAEYIFFVRAGGILDTCLFCSSVSYYGMLFTRSHSRWHMHFSVIGSWFHDHAFFFSLALIFLVRSPFYFQVIGWFKLYESFRFLPHIRRASSFMTIIFSTVFPALLIQGRSI
jgi:hypothetical protein